MSNVGIALVKYLCPVCGKVAEEGIIMNSLLTEKNAKAAEELNGKAVGYADHVCKECAEYKDSALFLIGIDSKLSTKDEPYRTGDIVGIKKDSELANKCKEYTKTLEDGTQFAFIDYDLGVNIGIWK